MNALKNIVNVLFPWLFMLGAYFLYPMQIQLTAQLSLESMGALAVEICWRLLSYLIIVMWIAMRIRMKQAWSFLVPLISFLGMGVFIASIIWLQWLPGAEILLDLVEPCMMMGIFYLGVNAICPRH